MLNFTTNVDPDERGEAVDRRARFEVGERLVEESLDRLEADDLGELAVQPKCRVVDGRGHSDPEQICIRGGVHGPHHSLLCAL